MFESFHRASKRWKTAGHGLGLAIVEEIGRASRRRNQPFERRRLRNPVHRDAPLALDQAAGRGELMANEPAKKVLVIEDEPSIRNNIMLMLKVERYAADRSGKRPRRPGAGTARSARSHPCAT